MVDDRPVKILETLRETFRVPEWITTERDPFKTLIVTIISQNTADRNAARAFENLSKRFEIMPEALANAEVDQLENCLRVAGLCRSKSRAIKNVSKLVLEEFHGDLNTIVSLPLEEARRAFLRFPGVGPKTADVVLLFSGRKPTIPVDTHVNRVAKRLGLASANGGYEDIRESLQLIYDPKDYFAVHVLLISHGRRYCRAKNQLCNQCPVSMLCPSK